ncbi:N-acetylglucosamine-6-phosphate deacetylase [Opitutia bacterium ISCC 51]|nr:N-acetylglucosamine-6-phosphate deacetylase [Opitutae bacterium ISCC 51]QXD29616.1 N-acetylglucosamine-6-phosphate deacetylase [Opitutae bacterium ISCC 52]
MKLFDFQVNGFGGVDFQSDSLSLEEMQHAVDVLHEYKMTSVFLTLITDRVDSMCRKLEQIERMRGHDRRIADTLSGYHVEGPWISTEAGYHGAHPVELACKPTLQDYRALRDAAGGHLKLITLAPEVDGCEPIIEAACADGVRISLGHTNASESDIDRAIKGGATLATHVGNAVPAQMHRHDNVVQRLLARDELICCLIPDGIHLPPFVLQNFFRAKPEGKVFFTTDCMAAAGSPPGRYTIGPHELEVGEDGIVRLPGDTRFAGSSLTLDQGVENIIDWLGLDREEAIRLCSTHAAEHFGISL